MNKDGKNASDSTRELLEGIRRRMFVKYGEKGIRRIVIGIPLCLLALSLTVAVMLLFPIREIEVGGDVTMFNEGDVISAAEIGSATAHRLKTSIKTAKKRFFMYIYLLSFC